MISTITFSVAGGMMAVLASGRSEQLAWRFLRIVGIIVLALAVGAVAWELKQGARAPQEWSMVAGMVLCIGAAAIVFLAQTAARRAILFRSVALLAGSAGLAAAAGMALDQAAIGAGQSSGRILSEAAAPGGSVAAMIVAGQVLAGIFLGSITISWLLGHAYLTATRMTIAPLRHFTNVLTWAIGARIVFFVASVGVAWLLGPPIGGDPAVGRSLSELFSQSWLIVLMRAGVGLVAVGVFVWMVRDCVRLRSTQSATGILYFGSVFAYVGELASQQLLYEWGWPV